MEAALAQDTAGWITVGFTGSEKACKLSK